MRRVIYGALGAESGATMTEYNMFASICADSAAILVGAGFEGSVGIIKSRSSITLYSNKKFGIS